MSVTSHPWQPKRVPQPHDVLCHTYVSEYLVVTRATEDSHANRIIGVICPICPCVFLLRIHPSRRRLVGAVGIEPTTFGLKGRCSTTELRPYGVNFKL